MPGVSTLPLPPLPLRQLVGPTEDHFFDNPGGAPIFGADVPPEAYDSVLDFGCGCGRLARQLIQQRPRPRRYAGLDLHAGMVEWCRRNLAQHAPGFEFHHHDVRNLGLNPGGQALTRAFPVADGWASLVIAWSVFTHVSEAQARFYLGEAARVLRPDGHLVSTWFLFDKRDFPMMQSFQNALFINDVDPTNAVIFDRDWLRRSAREAGLGLVAVTPPTLRGYQWRLVLRPLGAGAPEAEFPPDLAPVGVKPPPLLPADAPTLGLVD
jgi:SAM-dependent methyltransferase